MPLWPWFFLLAVPSDSDDRFVHFLGGVPVGEIRMIQKGPHYTYLSQHFFRAGKQAVERFAPPPQTGGPAWASQSLLTAREPGCWAVQDELTRQRGEACVTQAGANVQGTLLGLPFTARYERQRLQELVVSDSRFARRDGPVTFADPFAEGLALSGSGDAIALSPPLEGARRAAPRLAGVNEDCLAAATAWVQTHPDSEVVLGLIDDGHRGWPHAWVRDRVTLAELDPSRPPTATPPRYLALPKDKAARVYLDLLAKRRTLRRVWAQ